MGNAESFYGDDFLEFNNSVYAFDIAMENYLSGIVLKNELPRIVYSSNDLCFRKRTSKNEGLLNMPFINYYLTGIEKDTSPRQLFNHIAHVEGIHVPELQRKLRLAPVILKYEATFWIDRPEDNLFAYYLLHDKASNEIVVYSTLEIGGRNVKFANFIEFNLEYNPTYTDMSWLEENRIQSINIDFEVKSYLSYNNLDVALSNEIVFNFLTAKGLNTNNPYASEGYELLTEYFSYVPVTGVTLDKETINTHKGYTEQLTATVAPSNASDKTVTWSSSDPEIMYVDESGTITVLEDGVVTITVTTTDGLFTDSCELSTGD